jgi:alkaline phosphatase D
VLTLGDQMYTDYPPALSLFDADYFASVAPPGRDRIIDCTAAEVRAMLQQRHRLFLNMPGWRRLHARYPCYPMWDDHEMVDNWGSDPVHSTAQWQAFREGGRQAYFDYQGSRVLGRAEAGADFDFEIEWGPMAIYALDLRSNRFVRDDEHAQICSPEQERRFGDFLRRNADRDVLGIALSVPMVHLPRWATRLGHFVMRGGEDFSDRWASPAYVAQRDRLLMMLHDHQRAHREQRILLLSGDIHVACAHEIVWDDGTRPLLQLVSSGITNHVSPATQLAARASILAKQKIRLDEAGLEARVPLVRGEAPLGANPYTQLNLGLIELEREGNGRYRVRFLVYGHDGTEPVCVYRSPWL